MIAQAPTDAERALVDGVLLRPELLAEVAEIIDPMHLTDTTCRRVYRALLAAHHADAIEHGAMGAGYVAAAHQLVAAGRWAGEVYRPGSVPPGRPRPDTADPIAAARVVAEAVRRRETAAMLARAAEDVARGSDPDAVLRRLGAVA